MILYCRLFGLKPTTLIYLTVLAFYSTFHSVLAAPYSSHFLKDDSIEHIKTYYSEHLNYLKISLKPRMINYISSDNYKKYQKIHLRGVLFTHQDEEAHQVSFVSSIDGFKRHPMIRNEKGVWHYILSPKSYQTDAPREKVRYKFLVDGAFKTDENGSTETSTTGDETSVYYFTGSNFQPAYGPIVLKKKVRFGREVIFRIKIEDARRVSLIGNFNHWDHGLDVMKKVSENIFELRKHLPKGEYIYLYRSGGEYYVDDVNTEKKLHPVYGRVSHLEIK